MNEERDYLKDISEIRSMMERSSKFLSLSGWAGVLAGFYALAGAYTATSILSFNPNGIAYTTDQSGDFFHGFSMVIVVALSVLVLAIGTAIILSGKKASKLGESIWNPTSRRMITTMGYPLVGGGLLVLILMAKGFAGLAAPLTLLFYGLALINASAITYKEVRSFGFILIILGLIGCYFVEYSIWLWAIGFGVLHIIYGVYLHIKYERD